MSVPCYACHSVDPACCGEQKASPFALLGVPPTLSLTKDTLEEAFHRVIVRVHPDVGGQGRGDGIDAAVLNQAYHTLLDPYHRAVAVYQRATGQALAMTTVDSDVLMFALEIEDLDRDERRDQRDRLWHDMVQLEKRCDWDSFLTDLLKYRYIKVT